MKKSVAVLLIAALCLVTGLALGEEAGYDSYTGYTEDNAFLREDALNDSDTVAVMPAYTPCVVLGEKRNYSLIEYEGVRGYVPTTTLFSIRRDALLDKPITVYVAYPCQVYSQPLIGAGTEKMLSRLTVLDVDYEYGAYYVAQVDGEKCYVPKANCVAFPYVRTTQEFAQTTVEAHIYMEPDVAFFSEVTIDKDHLLSIVGRSGSFFKLENDRGYIRTRDAQVIYFRELTAINGFWPTDQRLQYSQNSTLEPTDVTVFAQTVVEVKHRTNKYYLVHYQDQWGYVPIEGFVRIEQGTMIENRIAATLNTDVTFEKSEGTDRTGETMTLSSGTHLWALAKMEDGTLCALMDGTTGFVPKTALDELARDIPITARHIYAAADKPAYRFPIAGSDGVTIPMDTLLKQVATNGNLYCVEYQGERLYLTDENVYTDDNAETLPGHTQRYYLLLEKLDHKLTVFLADENGRRTDTVVKTIITAVGKPSTPTPSGIFTLGGKERWHRWSSGSRSPFAIEFATGRYIHGPIYWRADEASLKRVSLDDIGHDRTSGCLRMGYDDAMWLYYHCATEETTLEIVKREAE